MLPLINIAHTSLPVQPTLVATSIPENNTLRVPHDNVAPPVSSAATDPNARGNNQIFAQPEELVVSPPQATTAAPPVVTAANLSASSPLGAPATLLAQMMSQQLPPEVRDTLRGVLNEYEKLVVTSYVKYKPSNATLPEAEPAGVFSRLLQEKPTPRIVQSPATESASVAANTNTAPVRTTAATTARNNESSGDTAQDEGDSVETTVTTTVVRPPSATVINAYLASVARNATIKETPEPSVEETNPAS